MRQLLSLVFVLACFTVQAANVVPTDAQMPGTQPQQLKSPLNYGNVFNTFQPAKQCHFCHGDYNKATEPNHNWQGSMMSHAGRDPLFWAQLSIAEQDFNGSGDVCLRCHLHNGWQSGRSVPTDGSAMLQHDANGVECDVCHRLTNTNGSEHAGTQTPPFIANKNGEGFYGSAMTAVWADLDKLGPRIDGEAKHPSLASKYHRQPELCGTCHDVSNPVVGDLAPNHGAQIPLPKGSFSGIAGTPVETKAAFNNPPYAYGIVERTYSEHKASAFPTMAMSAYATLPADLKAGAIKAAYDAAIQARPDGNYAEGDTRFFTCQSCHLMPVAGESTNRVHNQPIPRNDMAVHDLTGGNFWVPAAIQYLDAAGKLRLGGGLDQEQKDAMNDGIARTKNTLTRAASLKVSGTKLKVVNLTGHKLISGYPEGRRMWLNIKWYDSTGKLLREDGKYGPLSVKINGSYRTVNTILDLDGKYTRIYEAHGSITQDWAKKLIANGTPSITPLQFNRVNGEVELTLGQLAQKKSGEYEETFHFILNNHVAKDNRIPPYKMSYNEARKRSALPVPASQYGNPGQGGTYRYWDELSLSPPYKAATATIDLLYQPTSWEYIQFLYLANNGTSPTLGQTGANLLDAWLNTGMADPHVMASTTWKK